MGLGSGGNPLNTPDNLDQHAQIPDIRGDESGRRKVMPRSNRLEILVGQELFSFTSEHDWLDHAPQRFGKHFHRGQSEYDSICIDAKGRVCTRGAHFMRATKDGAYPIRVYEIEVPDGAL
jgi:hypothetical protein